jgi:hypothetical protein
MSRMSGWLVPAAQSSIGELTAQDMELLHHFKATTWRTLTARDEAAVVAVHKDAVPRLSMAHPHLLYVLLSIAASHHNTLHPSKAMEKQALVYRQKTFAAYSQALQNVTAENYEAVVITSLYLLRLIPPPDDQSPDSALEWIDALLRLSEGTRILAGSRWSNGIEKLSVYALLCRELRTLPPPPVVSSLDSLLLFAPAARLGTTPVHPNPPSMYYLELSDPSPVFLPPSLTALLAWLSGSSRDASSREHCDALVPVFHVFGPIFLSLYYYHLNPDLFVRLHAFCSFLMPEFLELVKRRDPTALVLIAWWYSLAGLAPMGWWLGDSVRKVVQAIGYVVRQGDNELAKKAFEGSERIMRLFETQGREAAAKSVFENWSGINWGEGPQRAEEWEYELMAGLVGLPV